MHQDEKNYLNEIKKTRDQLVSKHEALTNARATMLCHWPSYEDPELRTEAAKALEKTMDDLIEYASNLDRKIKALEGRKLIDFVETKIEQYEAEQAEGLPYHTDPDRVCTLEGKIEAYKEMLKELEK